VFPANDLLKFFEKPFEKLSTDNWALLPVDTGFCTELLNSAENKFNSNQFKVAALARSVTPQLDLRNDSTFWLDAKSSALSDIEAAALQQLGLLAAMLKNHFRVSITEFECHYAVYPVGHYYRKHIDTTAANNKRVFSFVIYLNHSWQPDDGGELQGYAQDVENKKNNQEPLLFRIPPKIGTMILFKSDLEHEVLTTYKKRYSLTGWFRR